MSKLLVICAEANNRSVTIAAHLKYWNHDVLTAGVERNSASTLKMLCDWADRIISTDRDNDFQIKTYVPEHSKVQLWDIGPDVYPRPFNKELLTKVRGLMEAHKDEYKQ